MSSQSVSLFTVSHQATEAVFLQSTDWVRIPVLDALPIGPLEHGAQMSLTLFLGFVGKRGDVSAFTIEARIVDAADGDREVARVLVTERANTVITLPCSYAAAPRSRPELVAQWRCFGRQVGPDNLFFQGSTMSLTALVIPETET